MTLDTITTKQRPGHQPEVASMHRFSRSPAVQLAGINAENLFALVLSVLTFCAIIGCAATDFATTKKDAIELRDANYELARSKKAEAAKLAAAGDEAGAKEADKVAGAAAKVGNALDEGLKIVDQSTDANGEIDPGAAVATGLSTAIGGPWGLLAASVAALGWREYKRYAAERSLTNIVAGLRTASNVDPNLKAALKSNEVLIDTAYGEKTKATVKAIKAQKDIADAKAAAKAVAG